MENAEWVEFRRVLREEWERLWRERIDDKFRGEGIAVRDYDMLFLDRGTVIFASRDTRLPTLREIVEMWAPQDVPYAVPPHPSVGGWGKFIRTELKKGPHSRARAHKRQPRRKSEKQQLKKGGRGWLHME
jgi:hypothetical protein